MRLTRHTRLVTALVALVSVLFMQLAVAAYACPVVQDAAESHTAHVVSAGAHEGMIGCDGMVDVEQPALCYAHAQEGSQSLNKPPVPDVPPSIAIELIPAIGDTSIAFRPVSSHAQASWLMRVSTPPVSIRNCCFRI